MRLGERIAGIGVYHAQMQGLPRCHELYDQCKHSKMRQHDFERLHECQYSSFF